MSSVEERLARVEADVREQQVVTRELRDGLAVLRKDMTRRFDLVDRRFDAVDRRFESVDRRFDSVDRRFDLMDAKISRQFVWLVGLQVMTLAAIVTSLATMLGAIAGR